jgi:hypothetical protein
MLGMYPDGANKRLFLIRPKLPYWLRDLYVGGLQVGGGTVDLRFHLQRGRTVVNVETKDDVSVVVTSSWRRFSDLP